MKYENLTQLQKTALKGQVARVLLASVHDADLKVNIYRMLSECDKQYRSLFLEAIKEAVTFDEEVINCIYFEILNNKVPVYLWTDSVIEDIKWMVNPYTSLTVTSKVSIDKKEQKQNMLKSMFIRFIRNALFISPDAVELLLNAIQDDNQLEFLHSSCIYLRGCLQDMKSSEFYSPDNITNEIFKLNLNMTEPLSISEETKKLTNIEKKKPIYPTENEIITPTESPKATIQITKISLDPSSYTNKSFEEIPDIHSEVLKQLTECLSQMQNEKIGYVVQKVYKNSGLTEDVKQYKSEEEAKKFIEDMNKKYPDLQRTQELRICKKIIEE